MTAPPLDAFRGQTAVLATRHRKERAIAPVLERELGLAIAVPPNFDSDRFGTFSRDVPRTGTTQLDAARAKLAAVMADTDAAIAIASEGAFVPSPGLPWLTVDRELVVLWARGMAAAEPAARGETDGTDPPPEGVLELTGETTTADTNFAHQTVRSLDDAFAFADRVGFPDHGLMAILGDPQTGRGEIVKGIVSRDRLEATAADLLARSPDGAFHLETDMRALHNPTRMAAIAAATENLVARWRSRCPDCGWPGFWIVQRLPGLPCAACGAPTLQTRAWAYGCDRCNCRETRPEPAAPPAADPMHCSFCNP